MESGLAITVPLFRVVAVIVVPFRLAAKSRFRVAAVPKAVVAARTLFTIVVVITAKAALFVLSEILSFGLESAIGRFFVEAGLAVAPTFVSVCRIELHIF